MILRKQDIVVPYRRTITTLYHATDIHMESAGFWKNLWDRFVNKVKNDKNGYWICTGDLEDTDRPSMRDRKRLIYADRQETLQQEDKERMCWIDSKILPKIEPIKDKCLGMLDGDHFKIFRNGMTSTQYICQTLKIPYLGERLAYVGLVFMPPNRAQSYLYKILARHGKGGTGTDGNNLNKLITQNTGFDADLFLGGHTHKSVPYSRTILTPNKNFDKIKGRIVWYVRGGSFLRGYTSNRTTYVEQAEYNPTCCGWAEIEIETMKSSENNRSLTVTSVSPKMRAFV